MPVFTIPPDVPFLETLAEGLWEQADREPLRLARTRVFLPTRRAARQLREAFLRVVGGTAALLPRLQSLGDDQGDDPILNADGADEVAASDLPPALDPLRRIMLLMRLIRQKDPSLAPDQAAPLAEALATWLDAAQTHEVSLEALANLVPTALAEHWQETLRFLEILTAAWPAVLADEGASDPAERRGKLLRAQAAAWTRTSPLFPVCIAGSTGSVPAVGALLDAVATMPNGTVVLPGLDLDLDAESWDTLQPTHPQWGLKTWLDKLASRPGAAAPLRRADVPLWPAARASRQKRAGSDATPPRGRFISDVFRPAQALGAGRPLSPTVPLTPEAFRGLTAQTFESPREEAEAIALMLRRALEVPGKTACLITPDRGLAERVAAALDRWGIRVDDSAGASLPRAPVGRFLGAVLDAAAPEASPVAYAALLKHPLAAGGLSAPHCRANARRIEQHAWRGVRRAGGWAALPEALRRIGLQDAGIEPLARWTDHLAALFAPMTATWHEALPLPERLRAHLALAEALATTDNALPDGAARLWQGEAGRTAALWMDSWARACEGIPPVSGHDYARLWDRLARAVVVRLPYGQHPRLSLLGPLEARLFAADLKILGGLNEGVWPPEPTPDPWMSRPMKQAFGLPLPEQRVGLSAHDFVESLGAENVVLTRARRSGGAPTVPSRFWTRLETVLRAAGHEALAPLTPSEPWAAWVHALDAPGAFRPCAQPRPCPDVAARPKTLSVTEIGLWRRNPYAIYARHILKLRPLEDLDADVTAADLGTLVHQTLEVFLRTLGPNWPSDAYARLVEEGQRVFAAYRDRPQVVAFWGPRFERLASLFVDEESKRRREGVRPLALEASGTFICGDGFTARGRADRIDRLPSGGLEIVDYKTGTAPPASQIGPYEPQLLLLGLMAEHGGFAGVTIAPNARVDRLMYWQLSGMGMQPMRRIGIGDAPKKKRGADEAKNPIPDLLTRAAEDLAQLVAQFADPTTRYSAVPREHFAPRHDDYAHLARRGEWESEAGRGGR